VDSFPELLDHLAVEGGDVVGLATRHEPFVRYHLTIHPVAASIPDVRLQRRPRRERPPLHDARLDEQPRPMADGCDGLAGLEERAHEPHGALVLAQMIRVHHATREQQRVEVVRPCLVERQVDRDLVAPAVVLPSLDLPTLW
jgi:hypothetical protein